jgi:hypothetical protein
VRILSDGVLYRLRVMSLRDGSHRRGQATELAKGPVHFPPSHVPRWELYWLEVTALVDVLFSACEVSGVYPFPSVTARGTLTTLNRRCFVLC